MHIEPKKIAVGFITYGKSTSKYLPYFLKSIAESPLKHSQLFAVDNTEEENNENLEFIRTNYLNVEVERLGRNVGFAKANNVMIAKAIERGAEYYLALNVDLIIEPDMIKALLETIESDHKIAAVQPKILKWDFHNNAKTTKIDSLGLVIDKKHRFFDDRQGRNDDGKKMEPKEVFGFTGAAALLRLKALEDVEYKGEYFDELMFMYKEDCDLSYRLRLAGWKIYLSPQAVCYHDRTASSTGRNILSIVKARRTKSKKLKEWSFLNQLIMLWKFKNIDFSFSVWLWTGIYLFTSVGYAVIFEPFLIRQLFTFISLRRDIKAKRDSLKIRVKFSQIEKFMV